MLTLAHIKELLRNGKYAWPGGYPMYFLAGDNEPLSFEAVKENWREIVRAHLTGLDRAWALVAYDVNWEDTQLRCAHTNKLIESAYGED